MASMPTPAQQAHWEQLERAANEATAACVDSSEGILVCRAEYIKAQLEGGTDSSP